VTFNVVQLVNKPQASVAMATATIGFVGGAQSLGGHNSDTVYPIYFNSEIFT